MDVPNKSEQLAVRFQPLEYERLQMAAAIDGKRRSEFVRQAVAEAVKRRLAQLAGRDAA